VTPEGGEYSGDELGQTPAGGANDDFQKIAGSDRGSIAEILDGVDPEDLGPFCTPQDLRHFGEQMFTNKDHGDPLRPKVIDELLLAVEPQSAGEKLECIWQNSFEVISNVLIMIFAQFNASFVSAFFIATSQILVLGTTLPVQSRLMWD
jgi:hypothetical protein